MANIRNTDYDVVAEEKPARASVRNEIDAIRDQIARLEESLQDAHDRLQRHDERITILSREVG